MERYYNYVAGYYLYVGSYYEGVEGTDMMEWLVTMRIRIDFMWMVTMMGTVQKARYSTSLAPLPHPSYYSFQQNLDILHSHFNSLRQTSLNFHTLGSCYK